MKRQLSVLSSVIVGAVAVVAALAFAVSACGGSSGSQADGSKLLEGKTWRATAIEGRTTVQTAKGSAATAKFTAGQAGGHGSVNSWGATYTTGPGNTIQIASIMTTEMAGPQDLMDQEAAFYAALPKAATYAVTETSLVLLDSKGVKLVTFEAVPPTSLTGTEWQTTGYHVGASADEAVSSDDPVITAVFGTDGKLAGNSGVNQYSTTYTSTADGKMTISAEIMSTKMAGPEKAMAQESAFLAALPKTASYAIDGDQLTLKDASGALVAQFTAK